MARQTIDLGTSPNRGDGDPLRTAFDKVNDNFAELYAGNFAEPSATGSSLIPDVDATYDLGSADKQWADLYVKDFIYLNGARLETDANGNLRLNGAVIAADSQGSVFGDDSTLLVDGVNNAINLDGTVSGDIIPDTDVAYDLGSASKRFRDIYLSGSTIDLGGLEISNVGGELKLDGVKLITQSELDVAVQNDITTNVTGSVFSDDSTLLVDGVAGKIVGDVENSIVYTDVVYARNSDLYVNADDQASLYLGATNSQTIIIGASDSTIYLNGNQDSIVGAGKVVSPRGTDLNIATLDMTTGSADAVIIKGGETSDSDNGAFGGNVKINAGRNSNALQQHGDIQIGTEFTNGVTIGTYDGGDGFGNTVSLAGYIVIVGNSNNLSNIELRGNVDFSNAKVSNLDVELSGDLSGSVFADDSTLLVDGVNGRIVGPIGVTTFEGNGAVSFNNDYYEDGFRGGFTTDKSILQINGASYLNGSDDGGGIIISAGAARNGGNNGDIIIASGGGGAEGTGIISLLSEYISAAGTWIGTNTMDIKGSVFGDDSTMIIDGTEGKVVGPVEVSANGSIVFKTEQDPGTWSDGSIETTGYAYQLNFPTNQTSNTAPLIVGWNDYPYIQPYLPTDIGASEGSSGFVRRTLSLSGGDATDTRAPGLLLLNGGSNSSAGLYGEVRINNVAGDVKIGNASGTTTIDGQLTVQNFAPGSITQQQTVGVNNYTTTISQDTTYTKFAKVDIIDDGDGGTNTITRNVLLDGSSLRFDNSVTTSAYVSNNSTSGHLIVQAGGGAPVDGQRNGGNLELWAGARASGATAGGNIIMNSDGGDILIGPLENTDQIRIGGAPGYTGESTTTFYGDVNFASGKSVTFTGATVDFTGATFTGEPWISVADLKTLVAASTDFEDFQARIAAL